MKKKTLFAIILFTGLIAIINSCVKDTFTEQEAYDEQRKNLLLQDSIAKSQMELEASLSQQQILLLDSLKKIGGVINYSVGAILASDASWLTNYYGGKGGQQLNDVTITLAQHGRVFTVQTDESGIGSFKDLRIGTANVNIRKAGYTEVDFVVDLPPLGDTVVLEAYSIVRHVATMIPVFSITTNLSTITGIATVESDLTNDGPEIAPLVKIMAVIDVDDSDFWVRYLYDPYYYSKGESSKSFDYYGKVKQIAFHSTVSTVTTGADGSFSVQVPSTPDGLPIRIEYDEFALNQTLLQATKNMVPVWGTQSIRTIFGPDVSYSPINANGIEDGDVQSAYVEFSSPTGSPAAQPTTVATATAVLTSSGIVSINMTNPGEGYTQAPIVKIEKGTSFNSVQAEGTAVVSGGKVTSVTINSPGSGYKPSDVPAVTFIESIEQTASYIPEFTFSVVDITVTEYGDGYTQTAPTVTILGSGTGATAHAVMAAYLKSITVTNPGSGYTQPPQITISDNFQAWDEAEPVMTVNNPLFSVDYDGTNSTLWPASPVPSVTIVGDGAGATATATLGNSGKVYYAGSIVGGSGYTSAPVVRISGGGGFGATGYAVLLGNSVDTVIIDDPGESYESIPTISLTGGGGSGATATAVLGYPVVSIELDNTGTGYNSVSQINLSNGAQAEDYEPWCVVKYNMKLRDILFSPDGWFYSAVPTITITPLDANGSGAAATAAVQWGINDIVVDNPGSGYKYDNDNNVVVRISAPAGTGSQAQAIADLGNGELSEVGVNYLGQGYTAPPNVYMEVTAPGVIPVKQARMTATVSAGHVTGLTITDPGSGYDFTSYLSGYYDIIISTYNSAAAATAKANPESGKIGFITVDDPGAGYSAVPVVEIVNNSTLPDGNGFGSGAVATAVVTDGRISAINVTNAGSGYYVVPTVRLTIASSVMRAMAKCVVTDDGRIIDVDFSGGYPGHQFTRGFGYNDAPSVTFYPSVTGKGSGAEGVVVLNNGSVDKVIMTNQGSGYNGMNKPSAQGFSVTPNDDILATAGKSYVRDLYFGTGKRTIER